VRTCSFGIWVSQSKVTSSIGGSVSSSPFFGFSTRRASLQPSFSAQALVHSIISTIFGRWSTHADTPLMPTASRSRLM